LLSELIITAIVTFGTVVLGIVLGSYLNSKFLMKHFRRELEGIKKSISSTKEYAEATELVRNLNDLLKSEEARRFFAQLTKLVTQLVREETNEKDEPILKLPKKKREKRSNQKKLS